MLTEFVEDDEIASRQLVGEPALEADAGFGLEPVDQVDDVEEAGAGICWCVRGTQAFADGTAPVFSRSI